MPRFTPGYHVRIIAHYTVNGTTYTAVESANLARRYQVGEFRNGFVDPRSLACHQTAELAHDDAEKRAALALRNTHD